MEQFLGSFSQFGLMGCVLAVLIYDVFILQKRLLDILEKNTAAFIELKNVIDICQNIHDNK
jgi:lipid-A-disaccharide synthase-like uncharacterized protein